ncbi:hydroxymyristoyl-ACP dehydratase [Pedobacter frigidisoli]|uniref:3-hydroxyacyl-ACP dehydratase FabZ family protein n=1 Tax=Pedobacter frigidisoli TaxID=2530455 RepID=UPI00292D1F71|nr:hydroxymyristoyl-ACP dehydratase [Pedobacter frigidisoli]
MTSAEILSKLPYGPGFLFVGELLHIDENGIKGTYTFDQTLPFYQSHFRHFPVTPAVILTETMAQIGLVCLGIYLLRESTMGQGTGLAMSSSCIDFIKPVYPGEQVTVISEKVYFRFNKLSCKVRMENAAGETVCKGTISGMLTGSSNE